MSGARMRSSMNLRPLLDALDEFKAMPTARVTERLDQTTDGAFAVTQAFVHVKTGRLKASGRVKSFTHESTYEGTIQYGGPEAYWAPWEFSRDGHHPIDDDPAFHAYEDRYADAIDDVIRDV